MTDQTLAMHYVCTLEEARHLVSEHDEYWISNCGCREERGQCERSRMDVCLTFGDMVASGSDRKRSTRADVDAILHLALSHHLVTRPFRNDTRTEVDGICFCCDDCCGYFHNPDEVCDKGSRVERTEMSECSHCGECVDICYFMARQLAEETLHVENDRCYGCGLCVSVCPEGCIEMVARGKED